METFLFAAVRVKNMFLFDDARAEQQFHYRTVMINWLFTPGMTFKELAEHAGEMWETYANYASVPGHGDKDPSESWSTWYGFHHYYFFEILWI